MPEDIRENSCNSTYYGERMIEVLGKLFVLSQ